MSLRMVESNDADRPQYLGRISGPCAGVEGLCCGVSGGALTASTDADGPYSANGFRVTKPFRPSRARDGSPVWDT